MASPALLDISDLVAPIAGDNPAGTPAPFTLKQKLNDARKEFEPGPDGQPTPRKPEWDVIIRETVEHLRSKSKDLELATRLAEALVKQNGFAGLRDGLQLIREMVEQCWDRMYPVPDVEDGETIAIRGLFLQNTLSDPDGGPLFPNSVRQIPIVSIDGRPYSIRDRELAVEGRLEDIGPADFERAQLINDNIAEDLDQALAEYRRLNHALSEKLGAEAPNLEKLGEAIAQCDTLIRHVRGEEPESESGTGADGDGAMVGLGGGGLQGAGKIPATRNEAYRQISQIAKVLEEIEPHSPIPSLLRRAVELGKMPFKDLIRELVRDPNLLTELNREFGIKGETPPEEG